MAVSRERAGVVGEHLGEAPGPGGGVVDFVRLVGEPDRRPVRPESVPPPLREAAAVHDEQQVGTEGRDLLGQPRVVPVGVGVVDAELPGGVAQAVGEDVAAGEEAVVDHEDARGRGRRGGDGWRGRGVRAAGHEVLEPDAGQALQPADRAQVH